MGIQGQGPEQITHVTHPVIPAKAGICEERGFLLSQE